MFASLTASSTAFFSSGVKLDGSFTSTGFAGATILSAVSFFVLAVASSDSLLELSLALAFTSDSSATLSAGIVITPVFSSIVIPSGAF